MFVVGVVILVATSGTAQLFGGFIALIGAARVAQVTFRGKLPLPGGPQAVAEVEPGKDLGFDPEAEARERGRPTPGDDQD